MQYTRNNFSLHDFSFCRYRFLTHLTLTWYAYVVFVVVIVAVFFPLFFHIHFFLLFIRFISCVFFLSSFGSHFPLCKHKIPFSVVGEWEKAFFGGRRRKAKNNVESKRKKCRNLCAFFIFVHIIRCERELYTHTQPYHTLKVRINNIKSLFLLTQEGNCQMAFKQNELCVGEWEQQRTIDTEPPTGRWRDKTCF